MVAPRHLPEFAAVGRDRNVEDGVLKADDAGDALSQWSVVGKNENARGVRTEAELSL